MCGGSRNRKKSTEWENEVLTGHITRHLELLIQRAFSRERPFDIQNPFKALTVFVNPDEINKTLSTHFLALLLKLPPMQQISGNFGNTRDDGRRLPGRGKNLEMFHHSPSPLTTLECSQRI